MRAEHMSHFIIFRSRHPNSSVSFCIHSITNPFHHPALVSPNPTICYMYCLDTRRTDPWNLLIYLKCWFNVMLETWEFKHKYLREIIWCIYCLVRPLCCSLLVVYSIVPATKEFVFISHKLLWVWVSAAVNIFWIRNHFLLCSFAICQACSHKK